MCTLQHSAKRNSSGQIRVEKGDFGAVDSWEFKYTQKQLIKIANQNSSLFSTLKKYNVELQQKTSNNGWTHVCICPFKDHHDTAPSFGYNSINDYFHCFGCKRSGQTVQFIAYIENTDLVTVAISIIEHLKNIKYIEVESNNFGKIQDLLLDYADTVREFKQQYKTLSAFKYVENITWNLDIYLNKHVPNNSINVENLEYRILKLKQYLQAFINE